MNRKRRYVPDLVADMAECDANYIRLHRIFPAMEEEDETHFGISLLADGGQGDNGTADSIQAESHTATVTMSIKERCRYTTMLNVWVQADAERPWIKWPALEVRVYHDIKSAEVVSFERQRNFKFRYATPNAQMYQPDEKSQINRFFGELLMHCFEHGHALANIGFTR